MANVPVKNNKDIKMRIRLDIRTIATPCGFVDECAKSLLELIIRESERLNSKQSQRIFPRNLVESKYARVSAIKGAHKGDGVRRTE